MQSDNYKIQQSDYNSTPVEALFSKLLKIKDWHNTVDNFWQRTMNVIDSSLVAKSSFNLFTAYAKTLQNLFFHLSKKCKPKKSPISILLDSTSLIWINASCKYGNLNFNAIARQSDNYTNSCNPFTSSFSK